MNEFATVDDVIALFRPLSIDETERTSALLPVVSDCLRMEAIKVHKDLDDMIACEPVMVNVVRGVCVDIVARALNTSTTAEPLSQMSQSAGGYTISGTYAIPGGGTLQILKNDLKKLGLKTQKVGVIDFYGTEGQRYHSICE